MNSPAVSPKAPITNIDIETDDILYEMAEMLKTLKNKQKMHEIALKLNSVLKMRYTYTSPIIDDIMVIYSIAPFHGDDENTKFRELLTKLVKILNNNIVDLPTMKKIQIINYITKTLENMALK